MPEDLQKVLDAKSTPKHAMPRSRIQRRLQQFGINWGEPETVALVRQQALDGERITVQKQQKEDVDNDAEQGQRSLFD
jgi:hypothetical protein